ncbi:DUF5004 domain-containing protein [Maribacter thermophilus]|uniref:DUF5004 domain-containing protein n=1 Tax=Maribacter thermophilus TaxID=1197874 RepID=UPI00069B0438|nr:DUF5004 domain-containing protein [Maribacter thermophilus]
MKNKTFLVGILIIINCTLFGCGVDSEPVSCPDNFTGELKDEEVKLVGQWTLTGLMADTEIDLSNDNVDNPSADIYEQYSECYKDALFSFGSNRIYSYEKGSRAAGCNITSTNGTWALFEDQLYLIVSCEQLGFSLTFNESATEFQYTSTLSIQDVNAVITETQVTFTYTKVESTE